MLYGRKNPRYPSLAAVYIPELFEGTALLKDLSVTGCRIEAVSALNLPTGQRCRMRVEPEPASNVRAFEMTVEVRWTKTGDYTCEAGFNILESPNRKFFQRYVDYLDYRFNK